MLKHLCIALVASASLFVGSSLSSQAADKPALTDGYVQNVVGGNGYRPRRGYGYYGRAYRPFDGRNTAYNAYGRSYWNGRGYYGGNVYAPRYSTGYRGAYWW